MKDIDFTPVLGEILPTINNMIFSTAYFGRICGKNVIITIHQNKTVLIALKDGDRWTVDFHTAVSSRGQSIKTSKKIDGNGNLILLLDGEGRLWKLINAFEFSNEEDECLHLINEKCFYEWVPFRKLEGHQVLEFTGLVTGFAFLIENKRKSRVLQVYSSQNLDTVRDYTFKELNLTIKSESFLMTKLHLSGRNASQNERGSVIEALAITKQLSGSTYVCIGSKEVSLLNVSSIKLVSILSFERVNCIVLCYQTGKFLFVLMSNDFDLLRETSVYVFNEVICVEKCNCSESCIIWADNFNLHHSNIQFQLEHPTDFATIVHLKVTRNIMNVRHFVRLSNELLAVTINGFYYWIWLNQFKEAEVCPQSSDEILSQIFDCGLQMNALNDEISLATDYLKFKEIIQSESYKDFIQFHRESDDIVIRTNLKCMFNKNYWKIKQEATLDHIQHVEITNLEMNLCEGMVVKFKSGLMSMNKVELSFIGDFGPDFDFLVMFLGCVEVDKDSEPDEIDKTLQEIAKRRNCLKQCTT